MNLHAIVSPAIAAVSPPTLCALAVSAGYNIGPDFKQTPNYKPAVMLMGDVQPLSSDDLRTLGGLNQQGTHRKVYLSGNFEGIDRAAIKGGDLVTMQNLPEFPGPTQWLVTSVAEAWSTSGWVCLIVTLQLPQ